MAKITSKGRINNGYQSIRRHHGGGRAAELFQRKSHQAAKRDRSYAFLDHHRDRHHSCVGCILRKRCSGTGADDGY